jgi:BMFP domain-containing protein YqiC
MTQQEKLIAALQIDVNLGRASLQWALSQLAEATIALRETRDREANLLERIADLEAAAAANATATTESVPESGDAAAG